MKIGILTFYFAHNYGAVLQCYALQKYLERCGHDVVVIDYKPPQVFNVYRWFEIKRFIRRNPFAVMKELLQLYPRYKRYSEFENFIANNLRKSSKDETNYDLVVVGSDQVWNTRLTHGFDPYYWGRVFSCPKISYAASMEQKLSDESRHDVLESLGNFNKISVREDSLKKNLINAGCQKEIYVSVDPTLLLSEKEWNEFANNDVSGLGRYLFLYQVRNSPKAFCIAKKIARERNLKVIELSANIGNRNSKSVIASSPPKFVSLIKNAECVVATSFHGTVFSVLLKKDFYAVRLNDGNDSRIESLLSSLNMESRFIEVYEEPGVQIDWNEVEKITKELVTSSKSYLKECCV